MTRLRPCETCFRHVFVNETRCPFCGAACGPQSSAPIFNFKAGMSRAQRLAVVAAVTGQTALVGCASLDDPPGGGQAGAAAGNGSAASGAAANGAAANGAAGGSGNSVGGGNAVPVYGAPVPPEAGGGGQPVYGAPVRPDAGPAGSGGQGGTGGSAGGDDEDGGVAGSEPPPAQPVYGAPVPVYGAPIPPSK